MSDNHKARQQNVQEIIMGRIASGEYTISEKEYRAFIREFRRIEKIFGYIYESWDLPKINIK